METSYQTKRLILRLWEDSDAEALFELAKEPEIGYWCGWKTHESIEDSLYSIRVFLRKKEVYAICLKESGKLIGSIGLHYGEDTDLTDQKDEPELGYWIGKPYWGKGYVTEAAEEMLRHAFEDLNAPKVWVGRYEGNERSRRVQEKLGFIYDHRSEAVEVPQLGETRVGHVSYLAKEAWTKRNSGH